MTSLLIGSRAAAMYDGEVIPKDWDYFSNTVEADEKCDVFWDDRLAEWVGPYPRVATLDELYTIKLSHAAWDVGGTWFKHMRQMVGLQKLGAQKLPELYDLLYGVWVGHHGPKRMNLAQEAETFFADAVKRKYDHDSIHESVAYGDRPLYERFLKPGASVNMDMAAVKAASFGTQYLLFMEEIQATALERIIIPSDYRASPGYAHLWALRRTVTSLTKGWSSEFIATNYHYFSQPDTSYVNRHRSKSHLLREL